MKDVFEWADVSISAAFLTNVKISETKTQKDVIIELASAAGVYTQWDVSDKPKLCGTWTDLLKAHVVFTQYLLSTESHGLDGNQYIKTNPTESSLLLVKDNQLTEEPDALNNHDPQKLQGIPIHETRILPQNQHSEENEVYVNITISSSSFANILSNKKNPSVDEISKEANHKLCMPTRSQSSDAKERSTIGSISVGKSIINLHHRGNEAKTAKGIFPFPVPDKCVEPASAKVDVTAKVNAAEESPQVPCNQAAANHGNLSVINNPKNDSGKANSAHPFPILDTSDTAGNKRKENSTETENVKTPINASISHTLGTENSSENTSYSCNTINASTNSKRNSAFCIHQGDGVSHAIVYREIAVNAKSEICFSPKIAQGKEVCHRNNKKVRRKNYEELAPFKFFCSQCSFKSKRESHYQRHVQLHDQVSHIYECEKCSFKTIRLGNLRRHELAHSESELSCDLCTYRTLHRKLLIRHQRNKHINKLPDIEEKEIMKCSQCSYTTTSPYLLKRHSKVHSLDFTKNYLSFECSECNYKASRKEHLARHTNNVHGCHRPFLCHLCGKSFKRQDALKQHSAVHLKHPPFRCPTCDKGCRSQGHLKQHLSVHSARRLFLCELCGASFKTRAVQRKHILTIHHHPKAYSCLHCSRKFNTKYALRRHMKQHFERKQRPANVCVEIKPETVPKTARTYRSVHLIHPELTTTEKSSAKEASKSNLMPVNDHATCGGQTEGHKMAVHFGNCGPEGVQLIPTHTFIQQTNETATALLYLTGSFSSY